MPDNIIYMPTSTTKDTFTIHGCGKFSEEKRHLNREEAMLLAGLLLKWLEENKPVEPIKSLNYEIQT